MRSSSRKQTLHGRTMFVRRTVQSTNAPVNISRNGDTMLLMCLARLHLKHCGMRSRVNQTSENTNCAATESTRRNTCGRRSRSAIRGEQSPICVQLRSWVQKVLQIPKKIKVVVLYFKLHKHIVWYVSCLKYNNTDHT